MPASRELIQHWILNIAIEFSRELSDFVPFVESVSLNVVPVPGVNPDDYARAFLTLLDTGFIQAFTIEDDCENVTHLGRKSVEAIIEQRLTLPRFSSRVRAGSDRARRPRLAPDFRWRMTSFGGNAWEKLAQPDWSRCALWLTDTPPTDPLMGDIWSPNYDLLMAVVGWYRELNGAAVDRDSVRMEALHNHDIVYWKVLPLVYHATLSCEPVSEHWPGRNFWEKPRWFHDWWKSLDGWYKKPWELPDWPASEVG